MCARRADQQGPGSPSREPAAAGVGDALESLVHQFSDPYAFLRELVQNSLDAGSATIEIAVEFRPSADAPERGILDVDDWGEGMSREIIEPDAVVVDTFFSRSCRLGVAIGVR